MRLPRTSITDMTASGGNDDREHTLKEAATGARPRRAHMHSSSTSAASMEGAARRMRMKMRSVMDAAGEFNIG